MGTAGFIESLPKVELHRHLEGSIRPDIAFAIAQKNGVNLGVDTVEELADSYVFGNFDSFVDIFVRTAGALKQPEDLVRITTAMANEMVEQNVRYAEIIFAPIFHEMNGIPAAAISEALNEGRAYAAAQNLELAWIADIPRHLPEDAWKWTVEFITGSDAPDGAVALGLGGPEVGFPPEPFAEMFAQARDAGLASIPHAGETQGADSVRGAVERLGAERIGHGVRCLEDPDLVEVLIAQEITLDVSLTSNVLLGVVADYASHPLPRLIAVGLDVTLNTDDPGLFRTDLNRELKLAADHFGFGDERMRGFQLTAARSALCDQERRDELEQEILGYSTSNTNGA